MLQNFGSEITIVGWSVFGGQTKRERETALFLFGCVISAGCLKRCRLSSRPMSVLLTWLSPLTCVTSAMNFGVFDEALCTSC